MSAILPGATLGILGGGQLGRMTALAARELGYGIAVLDPDAACAAGGVADEVVVAAFDDAAAAARLARRAAVVTFEIEKIEPAVLDAAARHAPLRPGAAVLGVVQDRATQKRWLTGHGVPVGPWRAADSAESLARAVAELGPARAKARRGGYDGRGQAAVPSPADAAQAWAALGTPCVVEAELDLAAEFSLLVARRPAGETALYPAARNWHRHGILDVSVLPGPLPAGAVATAARHTRDLAAAFGLEGLLCVEWFLTRDGRVLVNELAPRPHNTFHATQAACITSQFEQFVRAVCDLPLGSTEVVRPAALANLLGDAFLRTGGSPAIAAALAMPGVQLHLYGKEPRPNRKIGHLLAVADTAEDAVERVRAAHRAIEGGATG